MELIDVPHFGWKPENSVLGLSAFVDFEITGFAFFRTEFRVDRVLPIWYRKKNTFLPHSNNLHIYSQPGGSYIYKVLNCDVILVAPRYWRVLVLSGCLFKSEIGNRKS